MPGAVDKNVTIRLEARDELTPALRRAGAEASRLAASADKTAGSLSKMTVTRSTGLSGLAADAGRVEQRMVAASTATSRFNTFAQSAGRSSGGLRSMAADAGRVESSLSQAGTRGVSALSALGRQAESSAVSARRAADGFAAIRPGLLAVGLGVGAAARSFMDFDKNMSAVAANTGATGAGLDALRAKAIELGGATQYSGAEAAAGMNELAKAGVNAQSILGGGLQGALSLAASGQMEVADAAETAASAMTQFGLSGSSVPHIADLLASGANKAQGSVRDMGMALNQTGLVAHQMGLSVEETVGGLTAFAKAGMTGSDAGTSFKTMLMRLNPSTTEAKNAMNALGVSAFDSQGKFVGFANVAGQLKTSMSGLTDEQKQAYLMTIFGQDAIRGATVLMNEGAEGIRKYTAEVDQYGAANQMAAKLTDNLSGDIERLGGSIDSAILSSGSGLNDTLRSLVQGLTAVTDVIGTIPAPLLQVGAGLVAINTASRFLPDLGPKFQAARAGAAAFRVEVAAQRTGMAGMSVAARELGMSVGQIATVSQAAGPRVGGLTAAFRAAGGGAGVFKLAAGGLVGVLGGPWGIALTAAGAGLALFAQRSQEAKARQEELKSATDSMTQTLASNGGAWNQQASQQLVAMAQQKNLLANYQNMNYSIEQTTTALTQEGPARQQVIAGIDAHIAALKEANVSYDEYGRATYGAAQKEIEYYEQQKQNLLDVAGVGSQAAESSKLLAAANAAVADKSKGAADASKGLADANKQSAEAAKSADEALTSLANTVTKGRNAQSDYYAAVDETAKKIGQLSGATTKNGADFDLTTEKGRNAQEQLLKLGNAARDAALAQVDLSGDTGKASAQMGKARDSFIAAAVKMGLNKQAAAQLATQLGLTTQAVNNHAAAINKVPDSKSTTFTTPGLADAIAGVTSLGRKIGEVHDKNVTITYYEKAVKVGGRTATADIPYANGGIAEAFANGGLRERHVAQIARPGAWRVWAEDETGGEAYIPLARSKRARSVAILEEVARRFGMAVTAQARGSILSFAGGGTTVPARGGSPVTVDRLSSAGWTIPVTAKVTKVTIPAGVQAPFLYTPGGKWDRGGQIPEVALSKITEAFKKTYVSPQQLAEAAAKVREAGGVVGGTGGGSASAVRMVGALASAPTQIRSLISSTAARYGLSANLVAAVVKAESGFNAKARSRAGAQGLMQLMPGTARSLGVKNPLDARQNLEGGVKYLSQLLAKFHGDTGKALAAYNAGPGRVMSGRALPRETTRYVSSILGDAGVKASAALSGARTAGKAAGSAVAATNAAYASAMRTQVAAKTSPDSARAAAIANALSMNGRGSYKWGGGHSGTYYKNSAALAADCSGFVGWAIGHAIGKNATGVTTTMLTNNRSLGYVKIDPKIAAKTAGAIMGNAGHVVMSLGDGRVIESYQTGKPVRIRKLASRDMRMAAWNTALGSMTQGTAAQVTGGLTGASTVGGSATDLKNLAQAQAEYAKALAASKIPASVQFARATVNATKVSAQFLGNIRKIRDRGFPEVAARILMMGEEDGAAVAASFASGDAKTLRNEQANLKSNAAYESMRKDLEASLSAYKGPPAWITAVQDNVRSNTKTKQFIADVKQLQTMGYGTLAAKLLDMGIDDGYDLARQAVGLDAKGIRNLRDTVADQPRELARQQDALSKRATITTATASAAKFIADIKKIRDSGYPQLALKLMELGESEGGAMASEAAKASTADMAKLQGDLTASEAIGKQAQSLLDQLRGVGQVLNVSVGQSTGSDPAIRYTAARPIDARPAPVQYLVGPQGGTTGASAPLVHVEHMHAANPADAASQMETRLGDAVAVAGVGRVI